ncbi:MAG: formimidoylglutamase [Sphingobacteriaceae bacterium]
MFNKYITFVHIPSAHYMKFTTIQSKEIHSLIRYRKGEDRIGSKVKVLDEGKDLSEQLLNSDSLFVVLGIPEDIGVRANFGRGGANTAFIPAIDSFLNQQSNAFFNGENVAIAGALHVADLMKRSEHLNPKIDSDLHTLRELTAELDERVIELVNLIITHNKIPVIIGGGHNNAYGNIVGASKAIQQKINVINCDPHADLRALEGRHSGNGFSYAFKNESLNKYAVLGLHEQYNNADALIYFTKLPQNFMHQTFEDIFVRETTDLKIAFERCKKFLNDGACGIELDLDAITNVPSSAKTSSGITSLNARQYVYSCGKELNALYLHIAEGAPVLAHRKADNKTGKLIAYLITDFMKGVMAKRS